MASPFNPAGKALPFCSDIQGLLTAHIKYRAYNQGALKATQQLIFQKLSSPRVEQGLLSGIKSSGYFELASESSLGELFRGSVNRRPHVVECAQLTPH